jgi:hypothetical protein
MMRKSEDKRSYSNLNDFKILNINKIIDSSKLPLKVKMTELTKLKDLKELKELKIKDKTSNNRSQKATNDHNLTKPKSPAVKGIVIKNFKDIMKTYEQQQQQLIPQSDRQFNKIKLKNIK